MNVGLALRSTVVAPRAVARVVPFIDRSGIDSVWFPSVGHSFDALDMCGISLGETSRLRVGTGVIKASDYDPERLSARVHTLSEASRGRLILGIGTGQGTGRAAIDHLVETAAALDSGEHDGHKTPIFFAALRRRILRVAYSKAQGAILNFCRPRYIEEIVPRDLDRDGFTLACYIKLFFAESDSIAREMLVDEMKMYNSIPQYHAMFREMGSSELIEKLEAGSSQSIPDDLREISAANPDMGEVSRIVRSFTRAGVDLPIVYPYIAGDEEYKVSLIQKLASVTW